MHSLEEFEFGREHSVGPLYSIVEVIGDDPSQPLIAKIFFANSAYTERQSAAERDRFLRQIVSQKLLSDANAEHWLPIVARGSDDERVWYIAPRFATSLRRWVAGEIPATDRSLYLTIRAVVAGLREIEEVDRRQHGNLKPENVLLSKALLDEQTDIVLTDPLSPQQSLQLPERIDVEAVGELVFQLVTHREYPGSLILPLDADTQWRKIGKNGRAWCELANDLLSPDRPTRVSTLEELIDRVEKLEVGPRSKKPYAIVGGIVGMAAAIFLVLSLIPEPPPECEPNSSAWQRWAQSMADDPPRWFRTLTVVANQPSDDYYQAIVNNIDGAESMLQSIAAASRDDGLILDPIQLLDEDVRGRDDVYLDPVAFEIDLSPNDWCKVSSAVATIEEARVLIDRFLEEQSQNVATLNEFELANIATLLQTMIVQADSEFGNHLNPEDIVPQEPIIDPETGESKEPQFNHAPLQRSYNMRALVELTQAVETRLFARIQSTFEALESDIKGIQAALPSDDPIAIQLPNLMGEFQRRDVKNLADGNALLVDANQLADAMNAMFQVADRSGDQIRFDRFQSGSAVYELSEQNIDSKTLSAWAEVAERYIPIAVDPRSEAVNEWSKTFDAIASNNEQLAELFPDLAADLALEAQTLRTSLNTLLAEPEPLVVDEDRIVARVAELRDQLTQLNQEIIVQTGDPEEWHTDVMARFDTPPFESNATNDAYVSLLEEVQTTLEETSGAQLKQPQNMAMYVASKKQEQKVREWLESVDAFSKNAVVTVEVSAESGISNEPINTWLTTRRDRALSELITALNWDQLEPRLPTEDRVAAINTLAEASPAWTEFQQKVAEVQGQIQQFADAAVSLDLAILGEEQLVNGASSASDAYAKLQSVRDSWNAVDETQLLANAVDAIANRLDLLANIHGASGDSIENWITQPTSGANATIWSDPAAARAIWQRLQMLPSNWLPAGTENSLAATLDIEQQLLGRVTTAIATIADSNRAQAVLSDIRSNARSRWLTHAESSQVASNSEIETLLQRRDEFSIDLAAGHLAQHPSLEFDARRFDIIRATNTITEESQLEPVINQFTTDLENSGLLQRLAADDQNRFNNFLRSLRDLFNEDARKRFDPNELATGPASADWTYAGDGNFEIVPPDLLPYTDGNQTIVFKRLDASSSAGGTGPFRYVATDEVSIRLFTLLITNARAWDDVGEGGDRFLSLPDRFFGPRPWRWSDGELVPAENWIADQPTATDGIHDADYYRNTPEPPSSQHPMTYVTPAAAMLAARSIGCRFPTTQEWNDARNLGEISTPNLRDAAWDAQFQYLRGERERLQNQGDAIIVEDFIWPDSDIFIPADKAPTRDAFIGENAKPAIAKNDGQLWFNPVDPSRSDGFHNLVGNVHEFVLQNAEAFNGKRSEDIRLADVGDLLQADPNNVRVIGGSAMSPPSGIVPIDQPQSIRLLRNNYADRGAFADVGFRLAFTLSGDYDPPLKTRFTQVLNETGYFSID